MLQLLRRDVGAFEELYERHSRIVYSLVLRILRQASTAEEGVQDVFLQLWRDSAPFDASRAFFARLLPAPRNRRPGPMWFKRGARGRPQETKEEIPQISAAAPE